MKRRRFVPNVRQFRCIEEVSKPPSYWLKDVLGSEKIAGNGPQKLLTLAPARNGGSWAWTAVFRVSDATTLLAPVIAEQMKAFGSHPCRCQASHVNHPHLSRSPANNLQTLPHRHKESWIMLSKAVTFLIIAVGQDSLLLYTFFSVNGNRRRAKIERIKRPRKIWLL